ncbi:uncharacterized protein TNCV_4574301 [Trichonephila clavipes]|nr:uncharacterized protein TNCV_4574301 [Trichonephila clavipes]
MGRGAFTPRWAIVTSAFSNSRPLSLLSPRFACGCYRSTYEPYPPSDALVKGGASIDRSPPYTKESNSLAISADSAFFNIPAVPKQKSILTSGTETKFLEPRGDILQFAERMGLKWERTVENGNEAPTEGEALGAGPVGPCLKASLLEFCQVIYSQFGLAIHQNDHQARRRFVEWAQNEIAVVPDFLKRILFSDEAHFWLNGHVNKQNYRIWSEANPQVYVKTPLHPEKLTVWCALWAYGIIGPYFFKNDEGHNVTVNGDRYRAMITNFFIPELNNHDVQELWFQQDGATCHTARATIDLLKDTFGDRLI